MYRMTKRLLCLFSLLLGACAEKPSAPVVPPVPAGGGAESGGGAAPAGVHAGGLQGRGGGTIAAKSPHLFTDPLPDMFKSIVVLDITIGRDGALQRVAVRRSNGFKQLEARA